MAAPPSSERPGARRAGFPWGTLLVVAFFAALNGAGIAWIRHGLRSPRAAFRVASIRPAGETPDARPAIAVAFSLPALAEKDPPPADGWIRLDPPVRGRSAWLTPTTLAFYPAHDLERGREYRVFLSPSLRGTVPGCLPEGLPLEGPKEFRFSIEPVRLLRAEQTGLTTRSEASLLLVFSGKIPHEELQRLSLKDARGGEVPYQVETKELRGVETFVWVKCLTDSPSVQVVFGPPKKGEPRAPKAAGAGAPPPPLAAFVVPLVREFRVCSLRAETDPEGPFSIRVGFTHPLDPAQTGAQGGGGDLSPFFEIEPPVAFGATAWGSEVRLRGEFRRRVRYAVTVKKGIRGDGVGELAQDFRGDVLLPELSARVRFPASGSRLSTLGNLSVAIEVAAAEELTIHAHRILENNLVHFVGYRPSLERFGRPLGSKTYRLAPNAERAEEIVVDLRDIVGPDPRGIWYLEAFVRGDRAGRLVSVSDLALTAKLGRRGARAPGEALVWVTSVRSGEPVPGAAVSFWSRNNQKIAEALSDADGVARFEAIPDSPDGPPCIAMASKDGDLGYLEIDDGRLSRADFDVRGHPCFREGHQAFLYTERAVYRPGDTIHARAIVASAEDLAERPPRRARAEGDLQAAVPEADSLEAALLAPIGWSDRKLPAGPGETRAEGADSEGAVLPPGAEGEAEEAARLAGMPLEWEVLRPDGKRFRLERCVLGKASAAELSLPIPLAAGTGRYEIRLRLPGGGPGTEIGRATFLVEEYMPNRIRAHLRIAGEEARFRPGETVPFAVEARYLFGLPAEGSPVKVDWRLRATRFAPEGWSGFRFGPLANADAAAAVGSSESSVGSDGLAVFSVELPAVETASPLRLEVSAAVADVGGRAVTAEASAPVDPTPFYLGLRAPEDPPAIGRPVRFACAAVDPAGKPFALEAADFVAKRVQRDWIQRLGPRGSYEYEKVDRFEEVDRRRVDLSEGCGELEIAFGSLGLHRIELRDPATGAKAELELWVSGSGVADLPSPVAHPERVEIVPSKPSYAPGTRARLQLRLPFPGTVLVSTELDRVEWARAFRAESRSLDVEVPVPETWADGNFYVAATVVRGIDPDAAETAAPRAWGLVSVPLDLSERKLHLTVAAPEEVRPGSLGRIRVVAAADDGAAVEGAEVSVALVDEGIISLAPYRMPDPFAHFFPKRAHGVEVSDLFGDLLAEVPLARARSRPGGDQSPGDAAAARLLSPILGRRVEPAVRWLGPATTAADGSVVFEFDAPRTTGGLRAIAVANENVRRFGSAEGSLIVRSPFFFELGLPRFLAPGDRFVAPVRVFNQTPRAGRASIEWTLSVPGGGPAGEIAEGAEADGVPAYATFGNAAVEIPAGGVETVAARLLAPEEPGLARASVRATLVSGGAEEAVVPAVVPARPSAAEETCAEAVEIPVRPPSPAIALGGSGKIAEGEPLAIRPALARALAARYRLVVSRFPEVELANAIRYLVRYPYGCLEQTASSAFPLVYLRDLIERTGIEVPPREGDDARAEGLSPEESRRRLSKDIDRFVLAGIQRILDMQSPAGWCSMWPGSSCPWPWGSIYAAHFLIEARAAGYPVPAAELDALLEYVGGRVRSREEESETDLLERAYGLYVLALAEKPDLGTLDALAAAAIAARENAAARAARGSPKSPHPTAGLDCPSAVYLLAAASYRAGRVERAKALLEGAVLEPRDVRDTGGALRSPARETAFLLSALLDVEPKSPLVGPLVDRLRTYRADGRWGTTQENAFAILSLGKYARLLAREPGGAAAEVRIGDAEPIAIRPDADDRFSWTFEGARPPEEIRVSVSGPGTLFYSWTEEGVPLEPPAEPVDSGIEVRRRYLDATGAPLDLANVRAGETVLVEISLRSDREARNVAVVDLLPAGLEVENPRLEGKSERVARLIASARKGAPKDEDAAALEPAATSHRDDRVVAFVDLPPGRRGILYHVCRAVTRGEFQVPPVRAEALYDPRIASVSGAGRMAIR